MLEKAKKIISHTRSYNHWEFYYAKQPKQWELKFSFIGIDGREIFIDASTWEYVLLKYPDRMFDIIIEAPDIESLSDDDKIIAAEILLDGILGKKFELK